MSMFERRHYQAIAATICKCPIWTGGSKTETVNSIQQMEMLIDNIADMFEADNPRFDRKKFIIACGAVNPEWADNTMLRAAE